MELSINLSKLTNVSYFDILKQDLDEVIWLANYLILKADNTPKKQSKPKEQRIRVDDETATGGWY